MKGRIMKGSEALRELDSGRADALHAECEGLEEARHDGFYVTASEALAAAVPDPKPAGAADSQGKGNEDVLAQAREALAEAQAQLDDLKKDATPAQRAKLDKAAKLLPALGGSAKKQDDFVALVLSVVDGKTLDATEGLLI